MKEKLFPFLNLIQKIYCLARLKILTWYKYYYAFDFNT